MTTKLIPYFTFDGQTAEAMSFYQSIFGGDLESQTYDQANMAGDDDTMKDRIIQACLTVDSFSLMARANIFGSCDFTASTIWMKSI